MLSLACLPACLLVCMSVCMSACLSGDVFGCLHITRARLVAWPGDATEGQLGGAVWGRRFAVHGVRFKTAQKAPLVQVSLCEA